MKKLMSIAKKASTALAALALVVATTSVPSACFHNTHTITMSPIFKVT